jgi:putative ubiquitin-RnfH superfamily antitoxin RatB of RatAB toxin-antitoxin module
MAKLRIEVVHAQPGTQEVARLLLPDGATALEAAMASGLGCTGMPLGIGGREIDPGKALRDGDRVEILRPLALDPGEARRRRARRRKQR